MQKVFVLSLFRTGTQSTKDYLDKLGYRTAHWAGSYLDQDSVQHLSEPEILELMHEKEKDFDAFTDTPHSVLWSYYDAQYPNSKFILIKRDVKDWVASVRKLFKEFPSKEFGAYDKIVFWKYFRDKPIHLDKLSDSDLMYMYEEHTEVVTNYFKNRNNLLVVELTDENKEAKITEFLGITDKSLTKIKMDNVDFLRKE